VLSRIRIRPGSVTTTQGMAGSRKEVGMIARQYWKDFKKDIRNPFDRRWMESFPRYLKMRTEAFVLGFPKKSCFNKPVPQELL